MDKPVAAPAVGAKEKLEKQARQLAYDTRYKVKQSMKAKAGGRIDPAAMRKAFISQLAKSPSAPAVKARAKQMLMGEGYIDIQDLIKEHTARALYKVFAEHHQKDKDGNTIPHEDEEISEEKSDEKTFKVRVTDKKTGNSYVRMASRSKIADLRSNPNISSVEMTAYGEPTKSEKYKGKSTAKAKQGLDPVGKEDGDVDNDGDKDSSDKYLMKRRKAIGKAIAASEDKVWTDFKGLVEKKEAEEKKITGEGVNNKKLIKVFPDEVKEQMETKEEDPQLKAKQKKANMAKKQVLMKKMQAVRMGAGDQIMASKKVEGNVIKEMEHEMKPEMDTKPKSKKEKKEEDDPRSMPTKINLAKNKMRAMGLNMGFKPDQGLVDAYQKVYQNGEQQIDEILEKGTRGQVGFRSGGQVKKDPKTGKEKYVQAMKTDKVTVMNKGTKASGGKKARKRPESPEGKAIGALMRHKTKQYSSERKASDARKAGDKKTAAKHDASANRAYQRRKRVSGTLFDKTGNFHDRADND